MIQGKTYQLQTSNIESECTAVGCSVQCDMNSGKYVETQAREGSVHFLGQSIAGQGHP